LFPEAPSGADVFLLQQIDEKTFDLAMEDWAIWCRWERAFHSGQTTQDTHPALPEDRARHQQIEELLSEKLRIDPNRALRMRGRFEVRRAVPQGLTSSAEWIVHWLSDENDG